jgi:dynein assembly factor 6, axonemal
MDALGDLGSLSSLLQESRKAQEESDSRQAQQPSVSAGGVTKVVVGGGKVGAAPSQQEGNSSSSSSSSSSSASKSIWNVDDLPTEDSIADTKDERPCPRYELSYKQSVGTEDTFLGLSDKSPASADSTHLVVKIHFPGSTMKQLELDVTKNRIKAESRTHRLFTYLPVSVDQDNGTAKFDTKKEVLTVTLPIIHEF